jgi:hypothetical protein
MQDRIPWQPLLREALAVLALPADEQIRINGPGCVICDLFEEFNHGRSVASEYGATLSEEQRRILYAIDAVLRSMPKADYECGNEDAIRPLWQRVRELAAEAQRMFGWEGTVVEPFTEIRPRIWQRPPMKTDSAAGTV